MVVKREVSTGNVLSMMVSAGTGVGMLVAVGIAWGATSTRLEKLEDADKRFDKLIESAVQEQKLLRDRNEGLVRQMYEQQQRQLEETARVREDVRSVKVLVEQLVRMSPPPSRDSR